MRLVLVGGGNDLFELRFDFVGRLPLGESGAVRDAEDVRVDRNRRMSEGDVEHDVGGLAAHAGSATSFSKSSGTSPAYSSRRISESLTTFLALFR